MAFLGMLHLVTMASNALTICYCIDVEMVGGTETDALYAPPGLKLVYRDLGGGESERELADLMANNSIVWGPEDDSHQVVSMVSMLMEEKVS